MPTFNDARIRQTNAKKTNPAGDYVLYWSQMYRRLDRNHALDYAVHRAKTLKKPLIVYEGLKLGYPWASARHHQFMLEGMRDNARKAKRLGVDYWPFVETPENSGRGLLRKLAAKACLVVTDDYPTFIIPGQIQSLARNIDVPLAAVDGNGLIPLSLLGATVSAAAHLRPRIHKLFADCWDHRAAAEPPFPPAGKIDPPFAVWNHECDIAEFARQLPIDQSVPAVAGLEGGSEAGHVVLNTFVKQKLRAYATGRNNPDDPRRTAASRLSPHLRHGHVSMQECAERVLTADGPWDASMIDLTQKNKREGFFHHDDNVNSFLDEALTWRDVGYHWHHTKNAGRGVIDARTVTIDGQSIPAYFDLQSVIPEWAMKSLKAHESDPREFTYTLEQFENADTHDHLWNAAQRELVATGRIHNYLRMLWGKKVLEWSDSVERAYLILEHLNNKYASDGRDPNSYTGIFWCFGLFDRPWVERKIFGQIRYMSSDNTAKKFDLDGYYDYVRRLPSVDRVRGRAPGNPPTE
uniref:hypothetical protein n=1 Tax=Zavarzinella formosa TaxID=360055 RepID=UPI0002DB4A3B|nr:hypothetical protein [Zavarzinella formosa]